MDRRTTDRLPDLMLFPLTFSYPLIRESGLPKEFQGQQNNRALTHYLYNLDFEYSFPLWR